jgi:hypothetical protein
VVTAEFPATADFVVADLKQGSQIWGVSTASLVTDSNNLINFDPGTDVLTFSLINEAVRTATLGSSGVAAAFKGLFGADGLRSSDYITIDSTTHLLWELGMYINHALIVNLSGLPLHTNVSLANNSQSGTLTVTGTPNGTTFILGSANKPYTVNGVTVTPQGATDTIATGTGTPTVTVNTSGAVITDSSAVAVNVGIGAAGAAATLNGVKLTAAANGAGLAKVSGYTSVRVTTTNAGDLIDVTGDTTGEVELFPSTAVPADGNFVVNKGGITIINYNSGAIITANVTGVEVAAYYATTVDITALTANDTVSLWALDSNKTFTLKLPGVSGTYLARSGSGVVELYDSGAGGTPTLYNVTGASAADTAITAGDATSIQVEVPSGATWTVTRN